MLWTRRGIDGFQGTLLLRNLGAVAFALRLSEVDLSADRVLSDHWDLGTKADMEGFLEHPKSQLRRSRVSLAENRHESFIVTHGLLRSYPYTIKGRWSVIYSLEFRM